MYLLPLYPLYFIDCLVNSTIFSKSGLNISKLSSLLAFSQDNCPLAAANENSFTNSSGYIFCLSYSFFISVNILLWIKSKSSICSSKNFINSCFFAPTSKLCCCKLINDMVSVLLSATFSGIPVVISQYIRLSAVL